MQEDYQVSVSSTINSDIALAKAAALAERVGCALRYPIQECDTPFALTYTKKGLVLLRCADSGKKQSILLFVDFVNGKNGYRLVNNKSIKQPLARAVGIKSGFRPTIFDATAGLGGDAFVLASLGSKVSMCERSPIMAYLLEDGLARASSEPKTASIVHNNLRLYHGNTTSVLTELEESFHTVYLDPMYPHRKNSALNKQSMRTIRELVGDDSDAGKLLHVALKKAANRVVVKRPEKAPPLSEQHPSHTISMKNSRYDVYLTFNKS